MTYNKDTLTFQRSLRQKAEQRIAELDAELAIVYDSMWACTWEQTRRLEQLKDRARSLETERQSKVREIETYYKSLNNKNL